MSKSKRHFEQEEELHLEVIEQGIQFNELDDDEAPQHYEDTYEEAKRIFLERISRKQKNNFFSNLWQNIKNKYKGK